MKNTMILLLLVVSIVFLGFIYFLNFREPAVWTNQMVHLLSMSLFRQSL